MCVATHCGEESSIFVVDDGRLERRFSGAAGWGYRGVVPEVFGFAERAVPQPDRSVSGNCRYAMQTHRRQSSLSRNGVLSMPLFCLSIAYRVALKYFHFFLLLLLFF